MSAKNTPKPAKKAGTTVSAKISNGKKSAPIKSVKPVKKPEKKIVAKKPVISKKKPVIAVKKPIPSKKPVVATKKPLSKMKKVVASTKSTPSKKPVSPLKPVISKKKPEIATKKAVKPEVVSKKKPTPPAKPEAVLVAKPRKVATPLKETPTHGAMYVRSGRHFYTEDRSILEMPELIAAQLDSYKKFIDFGIREALEGVFPIHDFSEERVEIHFKDFEIETPRYQPKECRRKNLNYESYLRVKLQMLNKETGEIKEDTVFLGAVPVMTEKGTFIINGVERVIVHQIIKADGISFEADAGVYTAKIKPKKGAWLEFTVDKK